MSPAAAAASAPGRLQLSGDAGGPGLAIALDRRAICRVEPLESGIELQSKDALTRAAAADVGELVARLPRSLVARTLAVAGAGTGLRVVTEWKLAGSGIDGDGALAVAAAAAVARALGRELAPAEILRAAAEAARQAGLVEAVQGVHAALWGGVVRTRGAGDALEAERLAVDPGRIEEALLVVDAGGAADSSAAGGDAAAVRGSATPGVARGSAPTDAIAELLLGGQYEGVGELVARETEGAFATAGQGTVIETVREAGGAARPLPGRLVVIWAPPGERGAGRREAVVAALAATGSKPLPLRVDLRGLELD